jgi:hypothetical protein
MSSQTNGATEHVQLLTLDDIEKVARDLESLKPPDGWMLIAPDGRVWKGDLNEVTFTAAMLRLQTLSGQGL